MDELAKQPARPVFLKVDEVVARTRLSVPAIYARMKVGGFPRPVKLGSGVAVAWIESELDQWMVDRIAERDAQVDDSKGK